MTRPPKANPAIICLLIADYQQTMNHARYMLKFVREFVYFLLRGVSIKTALRNARATV